MSLIISYECLFPIKYLIFEMSKCLTEIKVDHTKTYFVVDDITATCNVCSVYPMLQLVGLRIDNFTQTQFLLWKAEKKSCLS